MWNWLHDTRQTFSLFLFCKHAVPLIKDTRPLQKPTNQSSRWASYKRSAQPLCFFVRLESCRGADELELSTRELRMKWQCSAHTSPPDVFFLRLRIKTNPMGFLWLAFVVCGVSRGKKKKKANKNDSRKISEERKTVFEETLAALRNAINKMESGETVSNVAY